METSTGLHGKDHSSKVPLSQGKPIEWKRDLATLDQEFNELRGSPLAGETN